MDLQQAHYIYGYLGLWVYLGLNAKCSHVQLRLSLWHQLRVQWSPQQRLLPMLVSISPGCHYNWRVQLTIQGSHRGRLCVELLL